MQSLGGHLLRSVARPVACTLFLVSLASCGGSSSETPPPLEPLPVNVHYNRAATTLPGELGSAVKRPAPHVETLPEELDEPEPPKAEAPKPEAPKAESTKTVPGKAVPAKPAASAAPAR